MKKTILLVELDLFDKNIEVSIPGRGPILSKVDDIDLKAQPAWVWEYPSGKIYRLKNYEPYEEPWHSVSSAQELEDIDWNSMFEYVGEDAKLVADIYQQLQTTDTAN